MKDPIITGILAYGMSGRLFHAPFVELCPGFKFHAVVERSKKAAAEKYPSVKSYNNVEDILKDDKIELIIVNTPSYTHFDYAKQALNAGKHVLIEKPFTCNAVETKELFKIAKEAGKYVMAYQNRRWDSDFNSIKQVLESGDLGKLIEVNFRWDRYAKALSPKKYKELPEPGNGIGYDLCSHLLDQVISLFGKPLKSTKTLNRYRPDTLTDDYAHFHLIYPDQLNVYITASLLTANPLPSFALHGTDGTFIKKRTDIQEDQLNAGIKPFDKEYGIEPEGSEGSLTKVDAEGNKTTELLVAPKGDYTQLFEAVYQQIRNNVPYPVKQEDTIYQMELLDQPAV